MNIFKWLKNSLLNRDGYVKSEDLIDADVERLWNSGEFFRQAIEYSGSGFAIMTVDGHLLRINNALCRMLGYNETELRQTNLYRLTHPNDFVANDDTFRRLIAGEVQYKQSEKRYKCSDGKYLWLWIGITPVYSSHKNIGYFVIHAEDISRRKQSEANLLKEEQKYATLVENSPDVIARFDMLGKCIYINQQFKNQAGHLATAILDQNLETVAFRDVGLGAYVKSKLECVYAEKKPINFEIPYLDPEGERRYNFVWLMPEIDTYGVLQGILLYGRDITKMKDSIRKIAENESLLKEVFENVTEGITIFDVTEENQFCVANINRVTENTYGFTNDFAKGKYLSELVPEGLAHIFNDNLTNCLSNRSIFSYDEELILPSGIRFYHTKLIPVFDVSDRIHRIIVVSSDITDVKQNMRQLEMIGFALENAPDSITIADAAYRFVYVNKKACKSLGYSREELMKMNVPDVNPVLTIDKLKSMREALEQGEKAQVFVSKHRNRNGTTFPIEVTNSLFVYEGSSFVMTLSKDISNRVEIDDLLNHAEQDFVNLVERSPDIVVRYDSSFRCTYVNEAWERITGYKQFDMLGKTLIQYAYLPLEVTQRLEKILRHVIQTGQGATQEFLLPNAHTGLPVYLMIDVLSEKGLDGSVIGTILIARDISVFKRSEIEIKMKQEILEEAQQLGHIGSWELDLITNERKWSKETYRIFEMNPDMIIPANDTFMGLVHPDDRQRVDKIYCELGRTRTSYEVELRLLFPDGRVKHVKEKGITKFDNNGKSIQYIGYVQDITESKVLEMNAIQALEAAEEGSRLKSSFLANISHEVRTPMNAIIGFSNLLLEDFLNPEDRRESLLCINKSGMKLIDLLENLLELSRIESGQIDLKPKEYDLNRLLTEQLSEIEDSCALANKLHLTIRLEGLELIDNKEKSFYSDARRIKQVLTILCSNAIKFTHEGEIVLGIRVFEPGWITFYVTDTGIGIPEDKQEVIFELFVQADGSYSRIYEGLGIGLSSAIKIARALNGNITVVSKLGEGSTFSFLIQEIYTPRGK